LTFYLGAKVWLVEKFLEFLKADLTKYFLTTETIVKTKVCIAEIKKALLIPIFIIKAKVPKEVAQAIGIAIEVSTMDS
jgi:hypothetical protein